MTARLLTTVSCDTTYLVVGSTASSGGDFQSHARGLLVSKALLIDHSPFFANALAEYASSSSDPSKGASTWLEGETGIIRLSYDDPEVVEAYVQLLYTDEAPVPEHAEDEDEFDENDYPLQPLVVARLHEKRLRNALDKLQELFSKLYLFYDKVQDVTSKEFVLAMMESTQTPIRDLQRCAHPGPLLINTVYEGTKPGDPMRRWLSDSAVCFGHSGWMQDGLEYHPEYLQEVSNRQGCRDEISQPSCMLFSS